MNKTDAILVTFLKYLDKNKIPLHKITIQKGIYFLKEMGLPIKLRFEPYLYGPYSIGLSVMLDDMVFWDQLKQEGSQYIVNDLDSPEIEDDLKKKVFEKMECIKKLLDNRFDFRSLELASTVLFVMRTLEANNEPIKFHSVLEEVQQWKGQRFQEVKIKSMYKKLVELAENHKCLRINLNSDDSN